MLSVWKYYPLRRINAVPAVLPGMEII
jgi:hypothetical protein